MTALTREQVNEVMARHNDHWPADTTFGPTEVREYARYLRAAVDFPDANRAENLAQADALTALVDASEQETI